MTENTTASGAAYALLHILDAIKTGRFVPVGPESLGYCKAAVQAAERALAASAPVAPTPPASKRLIGWRTPDYLEETADAAIAKNWSVHHDLLPIFEGDVHTKLATPQAAPVAPAPQPAGFVLVPVEPTAAMVRAMSSSEAEDDEGKFLPLCDLIDFSAENKTRTVLRAAYAAMIAAAPCCLTCNDNGMIGGPSYYNPGEGGVPCPDCAAAPKAAPITDAEQAAWHAGLDEGRSQARGALHQGGYLPLPEPAIKACHCYSTNQVREAIDADRAARGAAQAAPDNRLPEAWTNLLAYVLQDDMHNRLTPRVVDIAYTAFMLAKRPNDEDGGASDWFNDTKPKVDEMIAKLRKDLIEERAAAPAPVAEDAEDGARFRAMINAALNEDEAFARIMQAEKSEPTTLDEVRALVDKARAQAAQPEGGAK